MLNIRCDGEVLARLTNKHESIVLESKDDEIQIFLSPMEALDLFETLKGALENVELDHMGLTSRAALAYGKIEAMQAAKTL